MHIRPPSDFFNQNRGHSFRTEFLVHTEKVNLYSRNKLFFHTDRGWRPWDETFDLVFVVEPYVEEFVLTRDTQILLQELTGLVESEACVVVFHLVFIEKVVKLLDAVRVLQVYFSPLEIFREGNGFLTH